MLTQAKRDNKVLSKYKARRQRALKKIEGTLIDSNKEALQKLLPFQPIANDKDYEKKFFATHLMNLFPHTLDFDDCFKLFRKNFNANLADFSDEAMVAEFITPYLLEHFHALKPKAFVRRNLKLLQECFGLSEIETNILYIIGLFDKMNRYYDDKLDYLEFCLLLASVLQTSPTKIQKLLMADMPLRKFDFIDDRHRSGEFELESFTERLMQEPFSKQEMMKRIARIYPKSTLEIADFSYMKSDLDMLLNYCKNAKNPSVFLYGKPGVGKNEIAALIAKELNRELWEIHNIDTQGIMREDRLEQFIRAQAMLKADKSVILLDECEEFFPSLSPKYNEDKPSKNTLNKMLESVKIPSIFLSNSANIDPAFLRRFDIVLEIHAPPKEKKQAMIEKALKSQRIQLDSMIISQICESSLSQGVLLQACKVAKTLAKHKLYSLKNCEKTPKSTAANSRIITQSLIQVLNEHLKLQGQKLIATSKPRSLPYDMSLIHASVDMKALCERIKSVCGAKDANVDSSSSGQDSTQGVRILAYGMAGSGKSEFAKALAEELDKPIILKKASDLLSMWVGGSEKNIAKAFREAEQRGAILVLDEVDSFLQDRSGASRSWEVSQVNEMLTQMESFAGIFIATTNFMDNLDRASIRRFDMKIEFKPLDFARLQKAFSLYAQHLGIGDYAAFLESTFGKRELEKLENICFGDFALIARGAAFAPLESAEQLLEKLQEEARIKSLSASSSKRVGF
ncbi:ATP-binding protein [Helicobacter canis]|uniref:Putative AAA family ATPase n=1 Tax=Helicobacter canis TaxID=29419 RepID=A0A377J5M5_9HELI|nr:ATP-binding protein [Helicobacter canis]STO97797.1 putative AAA family ATPase [Helicobacter canis]